MIISLVFVLYWWISAPDFEERLSGVRLLLGSRLDYFNVDLVCTGAAFDLDWHCFSLSIFLFSLRREVLHFEHAD
jgi:hypothetical protein